MFDKEVFVCRKNEVFVCRKIEIFILSKGFVVFKVNLFRFDRETLETRTKH